MIRTVTLIALGLPLLGACTIAGDALNPPRELSANCNIADAEPVPQTGLATTPPLCGGKFCS
ncbi:hypothetical protein RA27_22385 [Ruegeria sp. ANG-R]|uniref:hypothetical protein n=1 Tax=Ruegeria sp. ANG-R TaxID=1577903 RepID=UPI00057F8D63|nr:hypothetical protein [Ruegeria sp. ANG-R]KIC36093.1 hypothetical protein RA27_22385 [Ruegeria sp. ANG-R]